MNVYILIDGENIRPPCSDIIFDYFKDKNIVARKLIGDFTKIPYWKEKAIEHNLETIHHFTCVIGKNSSDIKLTIEAMNLMQTAQSQDIFAICSSDSDYSSLISFLKHKNIKVVGFTGKQANATYRKFFDEHILLPEEKSDYFVSRSTTTVSTSTANTREEIDKLNLRDQKTFLIIQLSLGNCKKEMEINEFYRKFYANFGLNFFVENFNNIEERIVKYPFLLLKDNAVYFDFSFKKNNLTSEEYEVFQVIEKLVLTYKSNHNMFINGAIRYEYFYNLFFYHYGRFVFKKQYSGSTSTVFKRFPISYVSKKQEIVGIRLIQTTDKPIDLLEFCEKPKTVDEKTAPTEIEEISKVKTEVKSVAPEVKTETAVSVQVQEKVEPTESVEIVSVETIETVNSVETNSTEIKTTELVESFVESEVTNQEVTETPKTKKELKAEKEAKKLQKQQEFKKRQEAQKQAKKDHKELVKLIRQAKKKGENIIVYKDQEIDLNDLKDFIQENSPTPTVKIEKVESGKTPHFSLSILKGVKKPTTFQLLQQQKHN